MHRLVESCPTDIRLTGYILAYHLLSGSEFLTIESQYNAIVSSLRFPDHSRFVIVILLYCISSLYSN